jgi:hypothetical protein
MILKLKTQFKFIHFIKKLMIFLRHSLKLISRRTRTNIAMMLNANEAAKEKEREGEGRRGSKEGTVSK